MYATLLWPVNLQNTSGLSILLHGVISLPDATSYDKHIFLGPKECKDIFQGVSRVPGRVSGVQKYTESGKTMYSGL